jgi:hypothetical protein
LPTGTDKKYEESQPRWPVSEPKFERTRWFKYDRDYLFVNKSQFVPVIFEPPCIYWSIECSNPGRDEKLMSSPHIRTCSGTYLASYSRTVKRPGREGNHSVHLVPRKSGATPPCPYMPSWRVQGQLYLYLHPNTSYKRMSRFSRSETCHSRMQIQGTF